MLPLFMYVKVHNGKVRLRFWLPLFLAWLLLLPVLIVLTPLIVLGQIILHASGQRIDLIGIIAATAELLCQLRGLIVKIGNESKNTKVIVTID